MTQVIHLLQPALGYLQLGMIEEANEEVEALPPELKTDIDVLGLRAMIYQESGAWQLLREVSGYLVKISPENSQNWIWLAYATRRCSSISEAEQILITAVRQHPTEPMIHFNLACYAARSGDLGIARERLSQAITLDSGVRLLSLNDPDLEPLWAELGKSSSSSPEL